MCRRVVFFIIFFLFLFQISALTKSKNDYGVWVYIGRWSDNRYLEILQGETKMSQSYVYVAGITKPLITLGDHFLIEGEVNIAKHSGLQHHYELNGALNLRIISLAENLYLPFTFVIGIGPSIATSVPNIEDQDDRHGTNRLLYKQTELAFKPPKNPNSAWELLLRIHHRSGVFGLVSDAKGSNFIGLGIRFNKESRL